MIDELDSLIRFTLPSSVGARNIVLRLPRMKDISGLIPDADTRNPQRLTRLLPLVAIVFIEYIDDETLTLAEADALAEDAELMRGLLVRIRTLLDTLREQGLVFALCPHCGLWEAEVSMNVFALTIAAPLPSTFDGPFFTLPSMATNLVAESRPPLPRAARFRVELPSLALGLDGPLRAGVLGKVNWSPEEHEYSEWYDAPPIDEENDDELELPIRDGPAWCAMSRLARAMEPPLTDEEVDLMPVVDFFFLDLVHYLVERAPVSIDTSGRIRCSRCNNEFIPVRRDFRP